MSYVLNLGQGSSLALFLFARSVLRPASHCIASNGPTTRGPYNGRNFMALGCVRLGAELVTGLCSPPKSTTSLTLKIPFTNLALYPVAANQFRLSSL